MLFVRVQLFSVPKYRAAACAVVVEPSLVVYQYAIIKRRKAGAAASV